MSEAAELREAAVALAERMGEVALRWFDDARRGTLAVDAKGDGSPVTRADREAELAARAWIERRFPDAGILGEEHGSVREEARLRFVLDPIDGTKTFVRGVPLWGSLVGVVLDGEPIAGAASYPAARELLSAGRGEGAWLGDRRVRVSEVARLEDATALTTDERCSFTPDRLPAWRALAARAGIVRSWGDCYGYLLVATGRAEVMVDPILSPWDAAPFLTILEEAGGVLTDWGGARTAFGGAAIATNARLADEVRALLRGDGR